jgi:NADPH:quinone reductase-like Zn-dependent oxidoreductase
MSNSAAFLDAAGTPLRVGPAPLPTPGPGEIVVKNAAVAINPLDTHMQDLGVFVTQYPAVFGCDVAGMVHEIGEGVTRFKAGDRVIGYVHTHFSSLVTYEDGDKKLGRERGYVADEKRVGIPSI